MVIEKGYLYHIYNQGNNQKLIFYKKENYYYFLKKLRTHILPYADIISWCLMPNHFHLMLLIRETEVYYPISYSSDDLKLNSRYSSDDLKSSDELKKPRTINQSIAIMLRSYTRAINKQENISGSLFRSHTKAECINCFKGITPSFINNNGVSKINIKNTEKQYPQICFDYIHQNPVKANMVKEITDWDFSSAKDYANLRNGKLINKDVAFEYIDFKL